MLGIDTDEVFLEHGPTCDVVGELPKVAVDSAAAIAAPEGTLGRKVRINVSCCAHGEDFRILIFR